MLQSFDLILFGGTGDLAMRKLLPALFRRHAASQITAGSRIIGVAHSSLSGEQYIAQVEEHCRLHGEQFDACERLLTDIVKGNLTQFMRRDELDAAWRWIDPIRDAWAGEE